ncbi:MAG TPA: hypothetical protein VGE58_05170 [Daejeonella sp.]
MNAHRQYAFVRQVYNLLEISYKFSWSFKLSQKPFFNSFRQCPYLRIGGSQRPLDPIAQIPAEAGTSQCPPSQRCHPIAIGSSESWNCLIALYDNISLKNLIITEIT